MLHKRYTRTLLVVFTCAVVALVTLFSYRQFASDISTLAVSPAIARQNDTVTLTGRAFFPGERVSVWITYPDYRVYGVAEVDTNGDGDFTFPYVPDFLGAEFTPVGKYVYTAHGQESGREVYAELNVQIGQAPGRSEGIRVEAIPGKDDQGSYFTIRGVGFDEEALAFWLRYPDATVLDLGQGSAGPRGGFEYVLRLTGAPTGHYAFTARGLSTGLNGIAEFDLTVGDLTVAQGTASLVLRPTADTQRNYAIFQGSDFAPGEIVSVWVTLPDNSTEAVGDVQADDNGNFVATLYISEQEPTGLRTYTAFGNTSQRRATARFTLNPGP